VGYTVPINLLLLLYLFLDVAIMQSSDVFLYSGIIAPRQLLFLVKGCFTSQSHGFMGTW
jgi:hypothetical protein